MSLILPPEQNLSQALIQPQNWVAYGSVNIAVRENFSISISFSRNPIGFGVQGYCMKLLLDETQPHHMVRELARRVF